MARKPATATRLRDLMAECSTQLASQEREILAKSGLCQSDLAILLRLSKRDATPVNQLAPKVGLTSGSMTTAVQRLKKAGFVTSVRQEKDKRVVLVAATPAGVDAARSAAKKREALLAPYFACLSERENQIFEALLKKIRKASK